MPFGIYMRVSRYLLMQFLVNAGFGILIGFGLYLIGVPYPVLWGVLAAILRICAVRRNAHCRGAADRSLVGSF